MKSYKFIGNKYKHHKSTHFLSFLEGFLIFTTSGIVTGHYRLKTENGANKKTGVSKSD